MKFSMINRTRMMLFILCAGAARTMAWDFVYSYRTVESPESLDHIVELSNIKRTSEGAITYWNPVELGKEARLIQKFVFPSPVTGAFLNLDYVYAANYGGVNFGSGSVWGSKDGIQWVKLLDAPKPPAIAAGHSFSKNLPVALLGGTELWIQARLHAQGNSPIVAQFLRYDANVRTNNCFDLKVNCAGGVPRSQQTQKPAPLK
jgi:hypothetical protein